MDGDIGSVVRNTALAPVFTSCGLKNTSTGLCEASVANKLAVASYLGQIFAVLANPSAVPKADAGVRLDHLYIYVDEILKWICTVFDLQLSLLWLRHEQVINAHSSGGCFYDASGRLLLLSGNHLLNQF
jgi:hypothetical protein